MAMTKKQYKQAVMTLINTYIHAANYSREVSTQDGKLEQAAQWHAIAADLTMLGAEIEELD
ncbi:hypothetical protein [Cloacibacillus porcorum]|uniref:hypothetical protein n=1 Tax=Cloacibacillus porcorum TaxID=1197717 RepID=UPI0026727E89|nr:hypothetical protein [Cloacibacillus porcorum]